MGVCGDYCDDMFSNQVGSMLYPNLGGDGDDLSLAAISQRM